MSKKSGSKVARTVWAGWGLTALASFPFVMSAFMKLSGPAEVTEGWAKSGWSPGMLVPIGILELSCLAIYLVPRTAVFGAILLTGYLGGAVATHLRMSESPALAVVVGVFVWGGIFLRERRLGTLVPLRQPSR